MVSKKACFFALYLLVCLLLFACSLSDLKAPGPGLEIVPTLGISEPIAGPTPIVLPSPTPKPTPVPCQEPGRFFEDSYPSPYQGYEPKFNLYLPPCYDQNTEMRYPLLILLHGSYGDYRTWGVFGLAEEMDRLIAEGMPPYIVAMPTIPFAEDLGRALNTTAIGEELLDYLNERYRALNDVKYRALGGLSYGALWTLRINDEIPGTWGKLGIHSTAMSTEETDLLAYRMAERFPETVPMVWVDCGRSDEFVSSCMDTNELLTRYKIKHEFRLNNGGHLQTYWEDNLPDYLRWYSKGWNTGLEE